MENNGFASAVWIDDKNMAHLTIGMTADFPAATTCRMRSPPASPRYQCVHRCRKRLCNEYSTLLSVYNKDHKYIGSIGTVIDAKGITDLVSECIIGKKGQTFIVDSKGIIVAHQDYDNTVVEQLPVTDYYKGAVTLADAAISKTSGIKSMFLGGDYCTVGYRQISGSRGWTIFVGASKTEYMAPVFICLLILIVILVVMMVFSSRVSGKNAEKVTTPLKQFIDRLEKLSEGDLASDTDLLVTTAEMVDMNKAIKTAIKNLSKIIADIRKKLSMLSR